MAKNVSQIRQEDRYGGDYNIPNSPARARKVLSGVLESDSNYMDDAVKRTVKVLQKASSDMALSIARKAVRNGRSVSIAKTPVSGKKAAATKKMSR